MSFQGRHRVYLERIPWEAPMGSTLKAEENWLWTELSPKWRRQSAACPGPSRGHDSSQVSHILRLSSTGIWGKRSSRGSVTPTLCCLTEEPGDGRQTSMKEEGSVLQKFLGALWNPGFVKLGPKQPQPIFIIESQLWAESLLSILRTKQWGTQTGSRPSRSLLSNGRCIYWCVSSYQNVRSSKQNPFIV